MNVLLEARPGSGKTTVAARLADLLRERRIPVAGFVTHEVRENGRRVGFELETFDGRRTMLAHVDFRGPPRVGKYGVDLDAFERLALPALQPPARRGVVVIDEPGRWSSRPSLSVSVWRRSSRAASTSWPRCTSSATRSRTPSSADPTSSASA
jgi:nucleoside-triphosphatase THEP1